MATKTRDQKQFIYCLGGGILAAAGVTSSYVARWVAGWGITTQATNPIVTLLVMAVAAVIIGFALMPLYPKSTDADRNIKPTG